MGAVARIGQMLTLKRSLLGQDRHLEATGVLEDPKTMALVAVSNRVATLLKLVPMAEEVANMEVVLHVALAMGNGGTENTSQDRQTLALSVSSSVFQTTPQSNKPALIFPTTMTFLSKPLDSMYPSQSISSRILPWTTISSTTSGWPTTQPLLLFRSIRFPSSCQDET